MPSKTLNRHRFAYIKMSFKLKRRGEPNDLFLEKLKNKIIARVELEKGKIIDKELDEDTKGVLDEFVGDDTEVVEI